MKSGLIEPGELANFKPGDRIKSLRGAMHGTIVSVLPDGRVVWRADTGTELTALPESLATKSSRLTSIRI
jgi:hypothetical protein